MSIQTEVDIYGLCLIHNLWQRGEADRILSIPLVFPKYLALGDKFVFSGLSAVKEYLQSYCLTMERINFLRQLPTLKAFSYHFWDFARKICFNGEIYSLEDGDIFGVDEVFFELRGPAAQVTFYRQGVKTILTYEISIATSAAEVINAAKSKKVKDVGSVRSPDLFFCQRHLGGVRTAGYDIPCLSEKLKKYVVTVLAGGVNSQKLFHPMCVDRILTLAAQGNLNFEVNLSDV